MKNIYLALCVAGTLLPLSQFLPFLREHGLDLTRMLEQLFANPTAAFFGMDAIVSAVVLWVFAFAERNRVRHVWMPIAASLLVGVSLGLPLLLYLRERRALGSGPEM